MIKIEKINKKAPVYDITVESNENFFANGVLVHNCAEIVEYTDHDSEIAVCNLASIALPKFIRGTKNLKFDHKKLYDVAYQAVINLNKVIDVTYYPVDKAQTSNFKHRPIGLGVQGLADVFFMFEYPYGSPESKKLSTEIAETIYFASLSASNDLAKKDGHYESYHGSPISKGILQYDMWDVTPSDRWDWTLLKSKIAEYGVRNSLVNAQMPTGSCIYINDNIADLRTSEGIKTYLSILEEQNIDWRSIEQTNDQQWIRFEKPIMVETRHGDKLSDKVFYNGHVETIEIELEDGTVVTCSENHKFLINRNAIESWLRADELLTTDEIVEYKYETVLETV